MQTITTHPGAPLTHSPAHPAHPLRHLVLLSLPPHKQRTSHAQPWPATQPEAFSRRPPTLRHRPHRRSRGTTSTSTSAATPRRGVPVTVVTGRPRLQSVEGGSMTPRLMAEEQKKTRTWVGAAAKGTRRRRRRRPAELLALVVVAAPVAHEHRPRSVETGAAAGSGA